MDIPELILASASPRRRELLEQVGLMPVCQPVDVDETPESNESPLALVQRLARAKAVAIPLNEKPGAVVIGADTVIDFNGQILGKPVDFEDAVSMLLQLSDNDHAVISGVCVCGGYFAVPRVIAVSTHVRFGFISRAQAERYWQSGEPRDKAGSYAIQGLGAQFVAHISGSYSNVVGLPLYETLELLKQARAD